MIIGFTGTQQGMTNFQKSMLSTILLEEKCSEFMHGDCVGADNEAALIALELGITKFTLFPPDNPNKRAWFGNSKKENLYEKWEWQDLFHDNAFQVYFPSDGTREIVKVRFAPRAPYLERNKHIVDNCEMMIACPKESEHTVRSGTWACIRYSWKIKRKIVIIPPINRT